MTSTANAWRVSADSHVSSEMRKIVKTVRLNHLRAALLAATTAGLLAAVALLVVVLYAQPAEANFPGTPGRIAYSSDADGDYEIYTITPGGGGRVQATDNSTDDSDPYRGVNSDSSLRVAPEE